MSGHLNLNTVYVLLGIVLAAAALLRGLWRLTAAAQKLLSAITANTAVTAKVAHDLARWRKEGRRADRELADRITRLEGRYGQEQPAAHPRPAHSNPRRPRLDRGRRMGPV